MPSATLERPAGSARIRTYELSAKEQAHVQSAIFDLREDFESPRSVEFVGYAESEDARRVLPDGLTTAIRSFRDKREAPVLLVKGFPITEPIPPTPSHWREANKLIHPVNYFMSLIAGELGRAVAYSSSQDGALQQSLIPQPNREAEQTGQGSVKLDWHTEDASFSVRPRFLLVETHRDLGRAFTTATDTGLVGFLQAKYNPLWQRRFLIPPDKEHVDNLRAAGFDYPGPEPVALLSGDPHSPDLRIDPPYMKPEFGGGALPGDIEAQRALDEILKEFRRLGEHPLVTEPGTVAVIDNRRAMHGRLPIKPHFGPYARWMQRMFTVSEADFQKLRRMPGQVMTDRVIDPVRLLRADSAGRG